MQHEEHLRYYFIVSIFIHAAIFLFFHLFLFQKKVSFRTEENKVVNVKLVNAPPESIKNKSADEQIAAPKTMSGFKNVIGNLPKLSQVLPDNAELSKKHIRYNQSKSNYSAREFKNNFTAAAQLYDSENDFNEPAMKYEENSELTFSDGEARKLLEYSTDEIKLLNIISDQECTLLLTINENGYIANVDIVKSTEDQQLDDAIVSVIGNWKFEPGASSQKAMLKLKYSIK